MHNDNVRSGFTVVEMIVIIVVAAVVLVCTIAMTQDARNTAMMKISASNLQNLVAAANTYAAEWGDRQFTVVPDNISAYGTSMQKALDVYTRSNQKPYPSIALGHRTDADGKRVQSIIDTSVAANQRWLMPISFDATPDGSFRMLNVAGFNEYLMGRFFDRMLYAPKDTVPLRVIGAAFDAEPEEAPTGDGDLYWSSYSYSAAAMYDPRVLGAPDNSKSRPASRPPVVGNPLTFAGAFRSPTLSQTLYPDLKTSHLEHHWLQNRPAWATECNKAIENGRYDGCEPHYFNHYAFSAPVCVFMDGHVDMLSVARVLDADERVRAQSGSGLWLRHPGGATDGYFESMAADPTRTSFHIFTRDGIRGRDTIGR